MGQALYRKYRSKKLSEVVGQEHITATLQHGLDSGNISHAYLLTGPRGVGKTSIARILAHEINGLPYDDDSGHLDIIEIDAASNRRIDDVRELREKVYVAPASAKYKIYIIDEVHMLTPEAFNALLKTLEEPPEHAIFILATTEIHKLPATIVSRTQHFTFRVITPDRAVTHLQQIANKEKIEIDQAALELLAEHGDGSFRDSISLLDQLGRNGQKITAGTVQTALGLPPQAAFQALTQALKNHNAAQTVKILEELSASGVQPAMTAKYLGNYWRQQILAENSAASEDFAFLKKLLDVPAARNPSTLLEITLLEYALAPGDVPAATSSDTKNPPAPASEPPVSIPKKSQGPAPKAPPKPELKKEEEKSPSSNTKPITLGDEFWQAVLTDLKTNYNTLYAVARMAVPVIDESQSAVELYLKFPFHKKRLDDKKNNQIIADTMQKLAGKPVNLTCVVSAAPPPSPKNEPLSNENLTAITSVFGAGELLDNYPQNQ
jgi:DNA polymerase-3 subunit gamma/tau